MTPPDPPVVTSITVEHGRYFVEINDAIITVRTPDGPQGNLSTVLATDREGAQQIMEAIEFATRTLGGLV